MQNDWLGENKFELNVVLCPGNKMAIAIANDHCNRPGYPTLTIKTFDPALAGGASSDTVSVVIERDGYSELWVMQNGNEARREDVFTAFGAFSGTCQIEQEDSTTISTPLEGDSYMPFDARIECN